MIPHVGQSVQFFAGRGAAPLAAMVVTVHEQGVDSYIEGSVDLVAYHVDGQRWTLESRVHPDDGNQADFQSSWRPIPE